MQALAGLLPKVMAVLSLALAARVAEIDMAFS
jgi:hypothetical protein